jgi:hypothetical protein
LIKKQKTKDLKMSNFQWYADKYKCTLIEAICDRDESMTAQAIAKAWKEDTGKDITNEELQACKPDSQESVDYERSLYND